MAIPAAKIAGRLSSGQFIGMVADDPDRIIPPKIFRTTIKQDHAALKKEERDFKPIPKVRDLNSATIQENFRKIKTEVQELVMVELAKMQQDPLLRHLILARVQFK